MNPTETRLAEQLATLKLAAVQDHYAALATEAAQKQWTHVDYLALIDGEAQRRQQLAIARRLAAARFPCLKTLDAFDWTWPKKINRTQVQNLFRLAFLHDHVNVIFLASHYRGSFDEVHGLAAGLFRLDRAFRFGRAASSQIQLSFVNSLIRPADSHPHGTQLHRRTPEARSPKPCSVAGPIARARAQAKAFRVALCKA